MGALIAQIFRSLRLLIVTVLIGAQAGLALTANRAQEYLVGLRLTAIIWLILIITFMAMKAVSGYVLFGAIGSMLAAIGIIFVGYRAIPLAFVIGTLIGVAHPATGILTRNPAVVARTYVRIVFVIMFWMLLMSMYVMLVPLDKNISAIPIIVISGLAVAVGTMLYGAFLSPRFYVGIAFAVFIIATLTVFFPQTFQFLGERAGQADSTLVALLKTNWLRVFASLLIIFLFALVLIGQITGMKGFGTAAWGLIVLILLLLGTDWFFFQGGMDQVQAAGTGVIDSLKEKDEVLQKQQPSTPSSNASKGKVWEGMVYYNAVPPGDERNVILGKYEDKVILKFQKEGVWIRSGEGSVQKDRGVTKTFNLAKYERDHGGRVPCFNGPLELTILPESRFAIQARPAGIPPCEIED